MAKQIITFFIGGAADASRYFGVGPNFIVRDYVKIPFDEIAPSHCQSEYLGYDAIYGQQNIQNNILSCISNKEQTLINIVGFSLGGWNAAHLSEILTNQGYTVDVLITLDPVGVNTGVKLISKIYWHEPSPKANHWINVFTNPPSLTPDDLVARAGGQWIPPKSKNHTSYEMPRHHREVWKLFGESLGEEGLSAAGYLLQFINRHQIDLPQV